MISPASSAARSGADPDLAALASGHGGAESSDVSALVARLERAERVAQERLDEIARQRGELSDAHVATVAAEARVRELGLVLESLRSSRSWRMTSPMRRCVEGVRTSRWLLRRPMAAIRASGLFDPVHYLLANPDLRAEGDPLRHYLLRGGYEGRDPSPGFRSRFYLDANLDVRVSGMNPLLHFVTAGRAQGRMPAPDARPPVAEPGDETPQAREVRLIHESGWFDVGFYLDRNPDVRHDGMPPVDHYVLHGWREGRDPSPWFDTRFYERSYPEASRGGSCPFVHYLAAGRSQGHFPSDAYRDEARRQQGRTPLGRLHCISRGVRDRMASASSRHGGTWGAARHAVGRLCSAGPTGALSLARAQLGSARRAIRGHVTVGVTSGAAQPRSGPSAGQRREALPGARTILLVGCDGLVAGSQVLLLNLAKWLHAHTALELRIILGADGALRSEYAKVGPVTIWQDLVRDFPDPAARRARLCEILGPVDLVYGNTVVAAATYGELAFLGAPVVSHIHELEQAIRAYVRPDTIDAMRRMTSTFIACSPPVAANLVANHGADSRRIETVHAFIERRPPRPAGERASLRQELGVPETGFLVVGCGTVYRRKGADLFIDTAIRLRQSGVDDAHFVWIGDHYWDLDPQSRPFGSWRELQQRVAQAGLSGRVRFLGPHPDPRGHIAAADAFFLPSREDPFPLVCLEAAQSGVPVVCFADAGGIPEFVAPDAGMVVPFLDVDAAAGALRRLRDEPSLRTTLGESGRRKLDRLHTDDVAVPAILNVVRSCLGTPPPVTVLVPAYNHGRFLERRIQSILEQGFRDVEIIVLDDASTDESLLVARRFASHPQVRIVANERNSGSPFRQWRKGIEMARGDFVWIAEGDDDCEPGLLEELLPCFADPDVVLAYCDSEVIDEHGEHRGGYGPYYASLDAAHWRMDHVLPGEEEVNLGLGVKNTVPNASAAVFRRNAVTPEMLDRIEGMRFAGDWMFHVQLARAGKVAYRCRRLNLHRKHVTSVTERFNSSDSHRRPLLEEVGRVHDFVLRNFTPTPSFRGRLATYLREQVVGIYGDMPAGAEDRFHPVSDTLRRVDDAIRGAAGRPMRIAFVTTNDGCHDGGSEQLWIHAAMRMAEAGHSVLAVIRRWSPEPYFFAEFRSRGIEFAFKDSVPEERLAAFAPDLVVVNIGDQDDGVEWYDACRRRRLPYVIVNHLTKEPRYWPIRHELQERVRDGNVRAERVYFTSRNNRSLMERRLGCPIPNAGLFHNPLYVDRGLAIPPVPPGGPIRLAMPARMLNIHKGQSLAIEVISARKWRERPVELHLYGNGPDEASLRDSVARLGLRSVRFHEPNWSLPNPDMTGIWRECHALLMTSFMEGMPLVLLNAMCHARVPIVTDIGGHREVVEDGVSGFVAAEPTPDAVDDALERAWQRLPEWGDIGRRARSAMLRFAPEDPVGDLVEKLEALVRGRTAR